MKMRFFHQFILSIIVSISLIMPSFAIKIGLIDNVKDAKIAVSSVGIIYDAKTNQEIYRLKPMMRYTLRSKRNTIAIKLRGRFYSLGSNDIVIKTYDEGFVLAKNRWYRQNLVVQKRGNGLTVINDINIEYYLMGVVPSEMPSSWNKEALKAQAIAARSYALANLGKRASRGYDLNDTPADQAYGGASAEKQSTNIAVIETKGQVLTYNNKIIPAYYCASAGGRTLNSGAVWNVDLPYLHSVASFDEKIKKNGHGVGMSQHGANNLANMGYNAYQILGYFYDKVHLQVIK